MISLEPGDEVRSIALKRDEWETLRGVLAAVLPAGDLRRRLLGEDAGEMQVAAGQVDHIDFTVPYHVRISRD